MSVKVNEAIEFIEDIAGNEVVVIRSKGFITGNQASAGFVEEQNVKSISQVLATMSEKDKQVLADKVESFMRETDASNFPEFVSLVKRDSALRRRIVQEVRKCVDKESLFDLCLIS